VAAQLEQLGQATGAYELIVTTITHGHEDRVNSFRLLAEEWFEGAKVTSGSILGTAHD
jgi:hypothetical protein